jgi:transcription antitermination factor NusG
MKHEFSKGEIVRIRKGAFAAFTGKVVAIDYDNERLKIKVSVKVLPSADTQLLNLGFLDVEKVQFS